MDGTRFSLNYQYWDKGEKVHECTVDFSDSSLFDSMGEGVITHIEQFLKGAGYVFDGKHLALVKDMS